MKFRTALGLSAVLLSLSNSLHAAQKDWIGNSGLWTDVSNWSPSGAPGAADDGLLPVSGATVQYAVASGSSLNSLTIDASLGSTLQQTEGGLTMNTLIVGNTLLGAYDLSGGSLTLNGGTAASHLLIGAGNGGAGTFTISAGSVSAKAISVGAGSTSGGASGSGVFNQTGGVVEVSAGPGEIVIGNAPGSSGRYNISAGSLIAQKLFVGHSGGNGTGRVFSHTGGTVTITGDILLGGYRGGAASEAAGTYRLGGSASAVLHAANVFAGASGTGTFEHDAGTLNLDGGVSGTDRALYIGADSPGTTGTYNLRGGSLNAEAIFIGGAGTGTLNQTGGAINLTDQLVVDRAAAPGSLGTYSFTEGKLNVTGIEGRAGLLNEGVMMQGQSAVLTANASGAGSTGFWNATAGVFTLAGGTIAGDGEKVNAGSFSGFGRIAGARLTNAGEMLLTGGASTISSSVVNDGTIRNAGAMVTFEGLYTEAGVFENAGTSSFENDYQAELGARLMGGAGAEWSFGLEVAVLSTEFALWNTSAAAIRLFKGEANETGDHRFRYSAIDRGQSPQGYVDNLAWGALVIESGNQLVDTEGVIYTRVLTLQDGVSQLMNFTGSMQIYYDPGLVANGYLNGVTHNFGSGGAVRPIPEPSALLLAMLGGSALALRRHRRRPSSSPVSRR